MEPAFAGGSATPVAAALPLDTLPPPAPPAQPAPPAPSAPPAASCTQPVAAMDRINKELQELAARSDALEKNMAA